MGTYVVVTDTDSVNSSSTYALMWVWDDGTGNITVPQVGDQSNMLVGSFGNNIGLLRWLRDTWMSSVVAINGPHYVIRVVSTQ